MIPVLPLQIIIFEYTFGDNDTRYSCYALKSGEACNSMLSTMVYCRHTVELYREVKETWLDVFKRRKNPASSWWRNPPMTWFQTEDIPSRFSLYFYSKKFGIAGIWTIQPDLKYEKWTLCVQLKLLVGPVEGFHQLLHDDDVMVVDDDDAISFFIACQLTDAHLYDASSLSWDVITRMWKNDPDVVCIPLRLGFGLGYQYQTTEVEECTFFGCGNFVRTSSDFHTLLRAQRP